METEQKKGMPLFTKILIVINILLFGITGIVYLVNGTKIIGFSLLVAGAINVLYLLFEIKTKNIVFVILNFIFASVSLWATFDFLNRQRINAGMIWGAIALIYIIYAFILLMRVNKKKLPQE